MISSTPSLLMSPTDTWLYSPAVSRPVLCFVHAAPLPLVQAKSPESVLPPLDQAKVPKAMSLKASPLKLPDMMDENSPVAGRPFIAFVNVSTFAREDALDSEDPAPSPTGKA